MRQKYHLILAQDTVEQVLTPMYLLHAVPNNKTLAGLIGDLLQVCVELSERVEELEDEIAVLHQDR